MSFSKEIKQEIIANASIDNALALGILDGALEIENDKYLVYSVEKDIVEYFKHVFEEIFNKNIDVSSIPFKKINYQEKFYLLLEKFDVFTILNKDFYKNVEKDPIKAASYLSGIFLSKGSINDPKTSDYHLEIIAPNEEKAVYIQKIMYNFYLNPRIIKRRNKLVVYTKDSEKIVDFMRIICATNMAFKFEDERISRDFSSSINRIMNCEIANQEKTLASANKQLKTIEFFEKNHLLDGIDQNLILLMKIRKDNPESSLNELCVVFEKKYKIKMTKSKINHWFRKLRDIELDYKEKMTK